MKSIIAIVIIFFALQFSVLGQKVTYSEIIKDDNRNMSFEVLGNFNGNYIVYKNVQRKHRLTIYDRNMAIVKDVKLDFITDKTFNVDFITYPDYFLLFYQFQKGGNVYCNAAKIDASGNMVGNEYGLDTTKIGFWADNKIYYIANSEDKRRLLLYSMQRNNDRFTLATSLFDVNLQKLDSTSQVFEYNERRETYGDLEVDNDGTYYFIKEISRNRLDYTNKLEFFYHKPGVPTVSKEIALSDRYVDDVKLKVDNLNKLLFINAFSYKKSTGNVEGLFTVLINKEDLSERQRAINLFDDSLRSKLTDRTDWRSAFENFYIRNIVLKKDSGILVNMEQYFTQNRGYNNNSPFNRGYYYDPYPYSYGSPGYYRFQRSYYDYYGSNSYRNSQNILYNYSDLLIFNFTKDLKLQWSNIINKKQNDVETDNFLSYATLNMGSEIHYLFVDKNKQVISDFALQTNGEIKRYATIKSGEVGYTFMPRLLKQVSARQVIVPCVFRNYIAFAKIDFSVSQ